MNELRTRLSKLRTQKGLSISEVALRMGISSSTYREWEQDIVDRENSNCARRARELKHKRQKEIYESFNFIFVFDNSEPKLGR